MSRFEIGQKVRCPADDLTFTVAAATPDAVGCIALVNDQGRYVFVHEVVLEPVPVVRRTDSLWFHEGRGFATASTIAAKDYGDWKLVGTLSMMSDGTVRFEAET